jgi:hypothetical protein
MLNMGRHVSLKVAAVAFSLLTACGTPLGEHEDRRSAETADEDEGLDLTAQSNLTKEAKRLLRDFVRQIRVIAKKDNTAQKAQEKLQTECDSYDLLKAQFTAVPGVETSEPYMALDALDDAVDKLWLMKKDLREKMHALSLEIVASAPKFKDYNRGDLKCIRSEARREFRSARPRTSPEQKNARMRGDIVLKALKARIPYATPGKTQDKAQCINHYVELRGRIDDATLAKLAADFDAIEAQKKAVKEAMAAVRKAARSNGVKNLPSEKDLEVSANNACMMEESADDDYAYDDL